MLLIKINQEQVYHIKISKVNELKRRINSDWAALSHTVIECAVGNLALGIKVYALAFMLQADILSTHCNKR